MNENERLINGMRTLDCIARQYVMPENEGQKGTVNFYALKMAYSIGDSRPEVLQLVKHYRTQCRELSE